MKQAEGASNAAKNLIKSDSDSKDKKLTSGTDVLDELKKTKADRDAMKAQAEGLQKEYDRVCEELNSVPSFFFLRKTCRISVSAKRSQEGRLMRNQQTPPPTFFWVFLING